MNIVPTQYWVDERSKKYTPGMCHPDNWAENQKVDYYCNKWEWDSECVPFTQDKIDRFATGIKNCIQKVTDAPVARGLLPRLYFPCTGRHRRP